MLTLESVLRTTKHMAATGQGQHRFGHEGTKPIVPVPRDVKAVPKVDPKEK